jgi:flagellar basal-body rod protein FlgG
MALQSLYTASTGMQALETKLDVIANNLANVNTTAFKQDRLNFEDLFYRQYRLPGAEDVNGNRTSTGIEVGLGVRVGATQTNYEQGSLEPTNKPLDMAIEGNGFFQIVDPNGDFLYTRSGNFGINPNGQLVLGSAYNGYLEASGITIPPEATGIVISTDGQVQIQTQDSPTLQNVGQIQLAKFINPDGLEKIGDNLYRETDASNTVQLGTPGQQGWGTIRQGFLEQSNVKPVEELINLIQTQRAFELNSQVVQAGDQMMGIVNNLRRFA